MIVNERLTDYIQSLEPGGDPLLESIGSSARAACVPVIRPETASLLKTLVALRRPRAILEIGTAVGYSALLMSMAAPKNCRITTIEKYEKRIPKARENIRRAKREEQIVLLEGDADQILPQLSGPYGLIFMDAAKGQYLRWLPLLLGLLEDGGLLVSDNVLQDGDIIESRFAVERRNRTIHSRMREYLYCLKHTACLETAVIPIGDGVALSVKTESRRFAPCEDRR